MMYYLILDPSTRNVHILTDMHGFREFFTTYEQADSMGAEWVHNGDCEEYEVVKVVKE